MHKDKGFIHFIGIGGCGMSGLAEYTKKQGYDVSGSDINENPRSVALQKLGIKTFIGHNPSNVANSQMVVYSTAIPKNNPEMLAAKKSGIPMLHRAEYLAKLIPKEKSIAITGTHGKTTTSSMIANLCAHAKLKPSFVIGACVFDLGSYAHFDEGEFFVIEADESDASFLNFYPEVAIVTNIDHDHMQTYANKDAELKLAFVQFMHQTPKNGLVIICIDDPVCRALLPQIDRQILTYGLSEDADIQAVDIKQVGRQCHFTLKTPDNKKFKMTVNMPGKHNVLNALAACAVAYNYNIDFDALNQSLLKFSGTSRRFQQLGKIRTKDNGSALIIDDYAHHPAEVTAALEGSKACWPEQRLIAVFQPHRYTRTKELWDDFVNCFDKADEVVILDIYPAGEKPIENITSKRLAECIQQIKPSVRFVAKNEDIADCLKDLTQDQDIIMMMGAGSISQMAHKMIKNHNIETEKA